MSAYTSQAQLAGYISQQNLISLTDDTNSGSVDTGVLASVIQACSNTVDGLLAATYPVPFTGTPLPTLVTEAATMFACEALYARRLVPGEHNPFKAEADMFRKSLGAIAQNGGGLDNAQPRAYVPGFVEGNWSRLGRSTI